MIRMAKTDSTNKNLKGTERRKTPFDVRVQGTMAEKPPKEKRPPRKSTKEELRANNTAMFEYGKKLSNIMVWAKSSQIELQELNRGKVGRPYDFSDSLIWNILSIMTLTNSSFRMISGFMAGILEPIGVKSPSYSRLHERAAKLIESLFEKMETGNDIMLVHACENTTSRVRRVGVDSTGINMSDTTLWRSVKWKTGPKNKGWLKIHALSDVDTGEILAYLITNDKVGDTPILRTLVAEAESKGHSFNVLYADGAYSSDKNWIFLCRERKIKFITSFKSNTNPKNNGCLARGEAARLWCSIPYDEWVERTGYGTRWKCECVFSDLKRIFPETVTAKTTNGIVRQLCVRIVKFNEYKKIRSDMIKITGNNIVVA